MTPFWIRTVGAALIAAGILPIALVAGMSFPIAWLVMTCLLLGVAIHQAGAER